MENLQEATIALQCKQGYGKFAKVDVKHVETLMLHTWILNSGGYAVTSGGVLMHRLVMKLEGFDVEGLMVDHINGNRLDNRKSNLRPVTAKQNAKNRHNDPVYEGLVGVVKKDSTFFTVHKNIECYEHSDERMCALCYDSIVNYCYGVGKRLNDNISREPLDISFWQLNIYVMKKLNDIKKKYTDFIGVKYGRGGWIAKIVIDLGTFATPEEAAREYDKALKIIKKNYTAKELNFPD